VSQQPTTRNLLLAARQGDQSAFAQLVDRYTPLLWSVARSHRLSEDDANDAVQTTWLRLVEHVDKVRDEKALAGWLVSTCRREALRMTRLTIRTRPHPTEEFLEMELAEPETAEPENAVLDDERRHALQRAFAQLPQQCQQLLSLLIAEPPPSYADVSAALSMPAGSIGPHRARCLARLQRLFALAQEAGVATGTTSTAPPPTTAATVTATWAAPEEDLLTFIREASTATVPVAVVETAQRNVSRRPAGTASAVLISDSAVAPHGMSHPPDQTVRHLLFRSETHEIHMEIHNTGATRRIQVRPNPPTPTRAVLLRDTDMQDLTPDDTATFSAHELPPGVISLQLHTPDDGLLTTDWIAI
jgi:RNA polymerase sigma factor (sigma-70 family)